MVSRMTKGTFRSSKRSKCCPSTSLSVSNPVTSPPSWVNPPIHLGCRKDSYVLIYWCHGVSFSHRLPSSTIRIGLDIFVRKLGPIFLNFTPTMQMACWSKLSQMARLYFCNYNVMLTIYMTWHPVKAHFLAGQPYSVGIIHTVMTLGLPKNETMQLLNKRLEWPNHIRQ